MNIFFILLLPYFISIGIFQREIMSNQFMQKETDNLWRRKDVLPYTERAYIRIENIIPSMQDNIYNLIFKRMSVYQLIGFINPLILG